LFFCSSRSHIFTLSLHDALPICAIVLKQLPDLFNVRLFLETDLDDRAALEIDSVLETSLGDQRDETKKHDRARNGQEHLSLAQRSEEHTSELQSRFDLVCRLLLE